MTQAIPESDVAHLFDDEDYQDLCSSIAESLSQLSEFVEPPIGIDLLGEPFATDEVDLNSSGWILKVLQVQAWLNLDEPIARSEIDADPHAAVAKLFRLLSQDDPLSCYVDAEGNLVPTPDGAEVLNARLELALKLRDRFEELMEETDRKNATSEWLNSWEEEDRVEGEMEPIRAKTEEVKICDFVGWAQKNRLKLNPTYQRGDVWPTQHAQKLIESILRGIPLPSIILLAPKSAKGYYEVVDGKQRLTALLRFVGQHPDAIARVTRENERHPGVQLLDHFHNNYKKFKRLWKQHVGENLTASREKEYYFPFPLPRRSNVLQGKLATFAGKYYYEILEEEIELAEVSETAENLFSGHSEYKVPIIKYIDAKPRQIHDVFHLYNRQGKHLNAEEIRNAVFHEVGLAKLILVASGDNSRASQLVTFIPQEEHFKLADIAETLSDYNFGVLRYRRSKLLSWVISTILQPFLDESNNLMVRSTAKQIDSLLENIRDQEAHPMRDPNRLGVLLTGLHATIEAHSENNHIWISKFKDRSAGTKWEQLQLVASIVGTFLVWASGLDPSEILETHREKILEFTKLKSSLPPRNRQNKTQWAYIGYVSLSLLELCDVNPSDTSEALSEKFGASCVPSLLALRGEHESKA